MGIVTLADLILSSACWNTAFIGFYWGLFNFISAPNSPRPSKAVQWSDYWGARGDGTGGEAPAPPSVLREMILVPPSCLFL